METLETSSNVSNFVRESYMSHAQSTQKRIVQVQSPKKSVKKQHILIMVVQYSASSRSSDCFCKLQNTGQTTNDRYSKQQEYSK
jgi:hypothetical protein